MTPEHFLETCQTGDILLFSTTKWYSKLIEFFTHSPYSHIGIVLRSPTFIHPSLTGLYLFESGYEKNPSPEDNHVKYGVQISDLKQILKEYQNGTNGKLFYRKLNCERNEEFNLKITKAHSISYDKPYDFNIIDWLKAEFNIHCGNEQKTSTFWCSAFVAFVYFQLGFLNKIDWTIVKPSQFSFQNKSLDFQNCTLDKEVQLQFSNS